MSSVTEDEYVIYVHSDEEVAALIEEIDSHNALVEQKWQEALAQAEPETSILIKPDQQTFAATLSTLYYSETASINYDWNNFLGTDYFRGYLTLIGNTTTNSYGTRIFSSFSGVNFVSRETKNNVENFSYQKALIDSRRTYAVNFSAYVTIYRSSTDSKRYPVSGYVEYYANGSSDVF